MIAKCPIRIFTGAFLGAACFFPLSAVADPQKTWGIPADIDILLQDTCYECHDDATQKGDIRLDTLSEMPLAGRLDMLNKMQEQLYIKEMPPRKKKSQPSEGERKQLIEWLSGELGKHNASKLEDKLEKPGHGNYVEHEKLFSGEYKNLEGFTYDRKWLISEFIFNEKTNAILMSEKTRKKNKKNYELKGQPGRLEIVNPFLLPKITGVRYFANEELSSGHFLTMVGNTEYIADHMIGVLINENKDYLPAVKKLTEMSNGHSAILNTRQKFLNSFIDDLCAQISGEQNESLLPTYTPIKWSSEINPENKEFNTNDWRGRVGAADRETLTFALKKFEDKTSSKEELIRKCERFWFHSGEDKETIERRLEILRAEISGVLVWRFYTGRPAIKFQPLSSSEMEVVTSTLKKYRSKGMPYNSLIAKCMAHWDEEFEKIRENSNAVSEELCSEMLNQLYKIIYERSPTKEEVIEQTQLLRSYIARVGVNGAISKLTQTLILSTEFVCRNEYGVGAADQHGRKMLSPRDASYAIAYALTDSSPDEELVKAAREGKLQTRED